MSYKCNNKYYITNLSLSDLIMERVRMLIIFYSPDYGVVMFCKQLFIYSKEEWKMKSRKKVICNRVLSLVMVLSLCGGYSSLDISAKGYVKALKVKSSVSVKVGSKVYIKPTIKGSNVSKKVTVKSRNKKIAKAVFNSNTKKIAIRGIKQGTTTVVVTTKSTDEYGDTISKKVKVTVKERQQTSNNNNNSITSGKYILNTNSMKFHLETCSSAKRISSVNKSVYNGSRDDLINKGYEPCKICNP